MLMRPILHSLVRHSGYVVPVSLVTLATVGSSGVWLNQNSRNLQSSWSSFAPVRFGRAFFSAASVALDYKFTLFGVDPGSERYNKLKSKVHLRSAQRLYRLCCKNGGVFIKAGQHVGALDYLLPKEYVETMKVLHNDAPCSELEDIKKVIEEDLKCKVDDVFLDFSDKPIGTASLAQVHRAKLQDGRSVAVKVQHPYVKAYSDVDMKTIDFLLHAAARLFPEFELLWLSEEMQEKLPIELDFLQEGRNAEKAARLLGHFKFLKVPKVYWDLSTTRVLTMEYCQGGRVDDAKYMKQHDIDVNKVTQTLGKMYSEMIFVHGFVHCDPHPGNVLVRKTSNSHPEIVLLDHGLYQTLTDEFRMNYANFWQSIIAADIEGIKTYSEALGAGDMYALFACMLTARSWDSVATGIDRVAPSSEEDEEIQKNVAMYIPQISSILNSIPRQMLLLLKTNDLLRGIEFSLKIRKSASSFINMSRCCVRALAEHDRRLCNGWVCRTQVMLRQQARLLAISVYEMYLWLITTTPYTWLARTFMSRISLLSL
ncbi:aarF domain-containing protein kinase 1-like [Patiria miniata]|uniref:Protein kinase domain-containing protein n=1 Tax=Patiria miniata TaxID=46514 RepID=A0A914B7V7_PATMI|nr:aarF domain-containing protein kinase 1-like [Patiria miniata]